MDCEDLSDLEEGEIFEYEYSPRHNMLSRDEPLGFKNVTNEKWTDYKNNRDDNLHSSEQEKQGYVKINLNKKLKLDYQETVYKFENRLESLSSDGEYKSDEGEKCMSDKKKGTVMYSDEVRTEGRAKEKHCSHLSYGTVEDIMTEIGETISRKSHCNYKRRKSRGIKQNFEKLYPKQEFWPQKVLSSHFSNVKSKKWKRNVGGSNSDSEVFTKQDVSKVRKCRRKKKKEIHHYLKDENEVVTKKKSNKQVRDFDEVRRNLLEKLKKQKMEEESKKTCADVLPTSEKELENSDIQEVEMLIDCTNYVDSPLVANDNETSSSLNLNGKLEEAGDEELDVIKLRLIALASNRKRKNSGNLLKTESCADNRSDDNSRDVGVGDLDRNELMLRAEALKTALLKKHQRRLNKLKEKKLNGVGSSSDNDGVNPSSPAGTEVKSEEFKQSHLDILDSNLTVYGSQAKVPEEADVGNSKMGTSCIGVGSIQNTSMNKSEVISAEVNIKRASTRVRGKRKKKKLVSQPSTDNSEKNEVLEEDDRALRSQLLSDLMKKKSLKDLKKKSVLVDSVEASVKKPPPMASAKLEGQMKPAPIMRNTSRKINLPKMALPVPKIPKPEIQRIIVHLGSEDSSDEEDMGATASKQSGKGSLLEKKKNNEEQTTIQNSFKRADDVQRQTDKTTQASYERSVELLLSQARRKIEGNIQTPKNNLLDTPEAVYKHLPPSQRLEYMRLKQKIAERERLKKFKNEIAACSSVPVSAIPIPPLPPEPANAKETRGNISVVGKVTKEVIETRKEALKPSISGQESRSLLLLPSSQALISKLKVLLKKVKIEKWMEENYEKEIAKLKNQLSLFEKKKNEQRFKIKKLAEESMKIYKVIQGITKEKSECHPNQKVEEAKEEERKAAEQSEISKISEVKEQNASGKKLVSDAVSEDVCPRGELLEYSSPLEAFNKVSDGSDKVDPNVVVCQFDLMGVCKDEECRYQHFRAS